ncbi:MAG TPA: phenylalanine--tRNA ligase subunit alpha [Gammaproteobacteria bacterium]|nr:phenylalanine--tRNA ligase subunit alpha [Gammaproteobacteria bacterium]
MDLDTIVDSCKSDLDKAMTENDVYQIKSSYLGKKSNLHKNISSIKDLPASERQLVGKKLSEIKASLHQVVLDRLHDVAISALKNNPSLQAVDVTLPVQQKLGSHHPITLTRKFIEYIFESHMGFSVVDGPEIEDDYHNFSALNFPKDHPARAMQDTFYLDGEHVLRTHTSPVQVRVMQSTSPPIRIITPGRVYRCDSDPTHSPMFHQVEGLVVDEGSSFLDLKRTLHNFVELFFGRSIRTKFRPSYFPFTEPSAEMDIIFNNDWLEVMGCGMVHPNVLKESGIDPDKYQGYAFGIGIDRMAMLRYGVKDLRLFFDNDIEFINQFKELEITRVD